jgi:hypothetical protein
MPGQGHMLQFEMISDAGARMRLFTSSKESFFSRVLV